ncbi:archaeosine synthase subunit alpha [Salinirubellus sp. GCM10025818]|uniref:archaeosine synthase subunit alpha n=1 Tax=Salinirubellus TaxID=2162630 RepID=UPI0030D40CA3
MTDHFEVHERDGAARLGELRLADPLTTPALVDDVLRDAGSRWTREREVPDGDPESLTVLPHRAMPTGTDARVAEAFAPDVPDVEYPSAAVVSPETANDLGTDAYVLSGGPGLVGHAERFVDALVRTRETIPGDTALYLAGAATPANAPVLAYAGVDLLDTDRAYVRGTEGFYLTSSGEAFLEDLRELPCACEACRGPRDEFTREDCAEHNVNALRAEFATVRERIRAGRLRDYVEGQARHEAWSTSVFRLLDQQYGYVEARTPILRRAELLASSEDTLRRVEIQRFADRVTSRYVPRFDDRPLVLVPCSATKPYSESQSHRQFHDAIQWRAHIVSMTSPIGVVPQELELTYPAQHYDSVVTGRWSPTEVEFVGRVLERYLSRADYPRVVAHVPEDGYREVVERAIDSLDVEVEFTVADHPTTEESLANLAAALEGEDQYRKREREHNTVRAVADYLFGDRAGEDLFTDLRTDGHYPKLRAHAGDPDPNSEEGTHLATLVPQYGTLSFTLAGAKRWAESDAPAKRVEIDAFVPRGSVLAPGIVDADDDIRVGDEVVIEGPRAFAVGRAEMPGPEMRSATRGVAVEVRHSEER